MKTKKNIILQTAYQLLNTCLPLITAPYLSRVLGAKQLGVFSYTSSIIAYFSLFAMMGTINYGTRSIASAGENRDKRSQLFWEIYTLQVIVSIVTMLLYIIYLVLICNDNHLVSLIQMLTLVGCTFDINWLFFGCEKFKITVTRSFIIRILTVISIILFVKDEHDLWIYTFIMLIGTVISNGILFVYLLKLIDFKRISLKQVIGHLKPNIMLFIPLIAMSVYHIMDRSMMGWLSTYQESGYYYNADKVINIPLGVLTGIGTVMLPRMTFLYSQGNNKDADRLFNISMEGIICLGVAICFGIMSISYEFVPFFFGKGYNPCILLIIVLSPVLLVKGISNTVRTQFLVPLKMESVYSKSVLFGAIVNVFFNLLLIPKLGAMGAVLGTLFAELTACCWQFYCIKSDYHYFKVMKLIIIYSFFGSIMFGIVRMISRINYNVIIQLFFEILIGGSLYVILCFLYWIFSKNQIYDNIISDELLKKIKMKFVK